MLIGMGGNVGTQSSTVTVRGIATGHINAGTAIKTILKEAMVGFSLGTVMGTLVALVAFVWQDSLIFRCCCRFSYVGEYVYGSNFRYFSSYIF